MLELSRTLVMVAWVYTPMAIMSMVRIAPKIPSLRRAEPLSEVRCLVILPLIRKPHAVARVMYVLTIISAPSEKNVLSANSLGENNVVDPFIRRAQTYAATNRAVSRGMTMKYALNVRSPARYAIIAATSMSSAAHLSAEWSANLFCLTGSYDILNIGLPWISTALPPVSLIGSTEKAGGIFKDELVPLSFPPSS